MTDVTVRQLEGEEIKEIFHWLVMYAFAPSPPLPDQESWWERMTKRLESTYFALFEDDTPMACTVHTAMPQNIRGHIYSSGGVWCRTRRTAAAIRRFAFSVASLRSGWTHEHCSRMFDIWNR